MAWLSDGGRLSRSLLYKGLGLRKGATILDISIGLWVLTGTSHSDQVSSFVFDRTFRLVRERDRLRMWEYTLEVRPV
jgi:hypothetical protein